MNIMKKTLLLSICLMLMMGYSQAQLQSPAPSPAATVSQVVGFTKISMEYSSPGVKGRTIFGDLVKYDTPWRAGANAATTIEFSTSVNIGGEILRAGTYSMYITPKESGAWRIHLNRTGKAIFSYMSDSGIDMETLSKDLAVNVDVTPNMSNDSMERMIFMINANDNKTATITMAWDKVRLSFDVDTQVDQKLKSWSESFN